MPPKTRKTTQVTEQDQAMVKFATSESLTHSPPSKGTTPRHGRDKRHKMTHPVTPVEREPPDINKEIDMEVENAEVMEGSQHTSEEDKMETTTEETTTAKDTETTDIYAAPPPTNKPPSEANKTNDMETDDTDTETFKVVQNTQNNKSNTSRKLDFTKIGLSPNNRSKMEYWNFKIACQPTDIKDGNIPNWIRARLKAFYIQAKKIDTQFVLYKYRPAANEPDAILDTAGFPDSFEKLQGEGPANRYTDCYFYGLRTYNSKGKTMNIYTEIRVGYTKDDMMQCIQSWVLTQIPQPYIRPKDLQAPDTTEIGFLFGCNPFMREKPVHKILQRIVTDLTIRARAPNVVFSVSQRFIQDGQYGKNKAEGRSSPMTQNRALHVEARTEEKSMVKALLQKALKEPLWRLYTNARISLLPSWRDAEDKSRAAYCIAKHRTAMSNLAWETTDIISNPDHANGDVVDPDTGKKMTLRIILMEMEIPVEITQFKEGKKVKKQTTDRLFMSLDETWGEQGKWALVFPTAYAATAKKKITGLYVYIRQMVMDNLGESTEEADLSIACWFKPHARIEAEGMYINEAGELITEEVLNQKDSVEFLCNAPWFVDNEASPAKATEITAIDKTARKYNAGDTASLHTQGTTKTTLMSKELAQVIANAKQANTEGQADKEGHGEQQNNE